MEVQGCGAIRVAIVIAGYVENLMVAIASYMLLPVGCGT